MNDIKKSNRPKTIQQYIKIKKLDKLEIEAWNKEYPDIPLKKEKKLDTNIWKGDVKNVKDKEKTKKKLFDIKEYQKKKPYKEKKPKMKNNNIFKK